MTVLSKTKESVIFFDFITANISSSQLLLIDILGAKGKVSEEPERCSSARQASQRQKHTMSD